MIPHTNMNTAVILPLSFLFLIIPQNHKKGKRLFALYSICFFLILQNHRNKNFICYSNHSGVNYKKQEV